MKTFGDIQEGDVLVIEGHEMIAHNVQRDQLPDGREVVRFEGFFTHERHPLFHTEFNGGTYGACLWVPCSIKERNEEESIA